MLFKKACILILCSITLSYGQKDDEIIRQNFEGPYEDGSYRWALQTGGGIFHEQRGRLQQGRSEEPGLFVEGQYQYTAPNGEVINLLYTAGENGFIPIGAHIPTPPPIPPIIQRTIDYLARIHANSTENDQERENFNGRQNN